MSTNEALRQAALSVLYAWDYPQGTPEMHRRMRALRDVLAIDTSGQHVEELQGREHETAQQPAMRRATREEKISNPRVYEVTVDTSPQPAQQQQEPDGWTPIERAYPQSGAIDIMLADGSVLCGVLPQADGHLWWGGAGTGEKFIDPAFTSVAHWRAHKAGGAA